MEERGERPPPQGRRLAVSGTMGRRFMGIGLAGLSARRIDRLIFIRIIGRQLYGEDVTESADEAAGVGL